MLNIYVCEDHDVQRRAIVKIIQNTILIEEQDMQLVLDTADPYALLEKVKASQNTGIYFLDIDLHSDINGMQLAQKIRLFDPRGFIIFITAHSELSYMTFQYRVEAMDFVLKDNPAEAKVKIRECLLKAMERYTLQTNKTQKVYTIEAGGRKISVDYDDIFFFETAPTPHHILLYTVDGWIDFLGNLNELEAQLGERFLRIHRAYLVAADKIEKVDMKHGKLWIGARECLISRAGKTLLRKKMGGGL